MRPTDEPRTDWVDVGNYIEAMGRFHPSADVRKWSAQLALETCAADQGRAVRPAVAREPEEWWIDPNCISCGGEGVLDQSACHECLRRLWEAYRDLYPLTWYPAASLPDPKQLAAAAGPVEPDWDLLQRYAMGYSPQAESAKSLTHEDVEALREVLRVSDRKHPAWDRAKAALALLAPQEPQASAPRDGKWLNGVNYDFTCPQCGGKYWRTHDLRPESLESADTHKVGCKTCRWSGVLSEAAPQEPDTEGERAE